jgi:hypothetical protein
MGNELDTVTEVFQLESAIQRWWCEHRADPDASTVTILADSESVDLATVRWWVTEGDKAEQTRQRHLRSRRSGLWRAIHAASSESVPPATVVATLQEVQTSCGVLITRVERWGQEAKKAQEAATATGTASTVTILTVATEYHNGDTWRSGKQRRLAAAGGRQANL